MSGGIHIIVADDGAGEHVTANVNVAIAGNNAFTSDSQENSSSQSRADWGGDEYFSDSDKRDANDKAFALANENIDESRRSSKKWVTVDDSYDKSPGNRGITHDTADITTMSLEYDTDIDDVGFGTSVYLTDLESNSSHISLGLSHKTMEDISILFQKHADGSFLTEKGFVRSLQTLEPSLYFSECSKLFDIYDNKSYGYVPINSVVIDLREIEVNGAIQAPILHFLSTKIAQHTLDAEDVSSAFHFLVQSNRELEMVQRERAAWDEQKIRMMLVSASKKRGASPEDVLTQQSIALQNLTRFQLDYQARTAHMLTEMRSRKEKFEIALREKEAEEVAADASSDALQEIRDMKRFSQSLYRNIETHEDKLLVFEANMKDMARHIMQLQKDFKREPLSKEIPGKRNPEVILENKESKTKDSTDIIMNPEGESPVDPMEFDKLLEKRKGLLDGIHDALRSLVEEQKYEQIITNVSEAKVGLHGDVISQIWELSLFMAHTLRILSIGFWSLLVWKYFEWSADDSDMHDIQFWIFSGPILILLLHQIYKFLFQVCYINKEPTDYTGLIYRPEHVGHFAINLNLCCISNFQANTCCEHFILSVIFTFIYVITIPALFLHDLTA